MCLIIAFQRASYATACRIAGATVAPVTCVLKHFLGVTGGIQSPTDRYYCLRAIYKTPCPQSLARSVNNIHAKTIRQYVREMSRLLTVRYVLWMF
ncbi:hypothetical protein EVAR_15081_1 [Eumeta japonica]|uniref:Uncharacterized protein n=1 Tax=Eumeta variegata TaxID=151549 RepID=A0A4C1YLS8_EUMVA|nr:hypothetical protein EVAR_15081_1 [Eumeta japonica]